MPSIEPAAWIALCGVGVAALLFFEFTGLRTGIVLAKQSAGLAFIGLALTEGAATSLPGQLILLGLVLCWLGDGLLLPVGQTIWFRLGIGAFLLGHLAYAVAFLVWAIDPLGLATAGIAMAAFGGASLRWLAPHVPADFVVPVRVYILVIGAMCATAISASIAGAPVLVAAGALTFAASDLSVARERFVRAGFVNSLWGLPAYFAAQLMIAYSTGAIGPL